MTTFRRLMLGAIPLLLLLLSVSMPANALFGLGIFNTILGTIRNSLGASASSIQKIQQGEFAFERAKVWPQQLAANYRNFSSQIATSYRPWMNDVYSLRIHSASIGPDSNFESVIHSGNVQDLGQLSHAYQSVYGPLPDSTAASTPFQEQADALDSASLAADGLSIKADKSATSILSQSQALSNQAQSTAQGTATMVAAQAEALQLESLAVQHEELAAMLRLAAARVGNQGSTMKQMATAGLNATTVNSNALNGTGEGN